MAPTDAGTLYKEQEWTTHSIDELHNLILYEGHQARKCILCYFICIEYRK